MADSIRDAAEYMALNYPIEMTKDDAGYFVRIPDLPGCESSGDTATAALAAIEEAREAWIDVTLAAGRPVPTPRGDENYSGKFVVRVGASVHRDLVRIARDEGVSLNGLVSSTLARETGRYWTGKKAGEDGLSGAGHTGSGTSVAYG